MQKIDYHLHTYLCKHAVGSVEEYIAHALAIGLDEIGFADHNPLPGGFDSRHRMDEQQVETYFTLIREARQKYPQIQIKIGFEVDYLPGGEEYLQKQLESYPFDYVYGSVCDVFTPRLLEAFFRRVPPASTSQDQPDR